MFFVRILSESDEVETVRLPNALASTLRRLPENPESYFKHTDGAIIVPLTRLIASHLRHEGVMNANRLMLLAAVDKQEKRNPLSVVPHGADFVVLDGNSTFVNACFSGWASIPCKIERDSGAATS